MSSNNTPSETSSDDFANAFAGLHLDDSTPNLNKYKLRCVALGCAVGRTIRECKANITAAGGTHAQPNNQPSTSKKPTKAERKKAEKETYDFFAKTYGANNNRLESWKQLCCDLGKEPGNSITQCKKIVKSVRTYIYDYVRAKQQGTAVDLCLSITALRKKIRNLPFPLKKAKESEFLKAMLVGVWY